MIHIGDCREVMAAMDAESVDAIVTDPPYELGFMGKGWDAAGVSFDHETWRAAYRVLKPGGYLLAFGGTRTFHRIAVAIEDAGLEIRDCLSWLYGSGFPKSLDVSKAIDKAAGAEREVVGRDPYYSPGRKQTIGNGVKYGKGGTEDETAWTTAPATPEAEQWAGWGTALKPAWEPVIMARKPIRGTVAANVLTYGTGALNVDATRIEHVTVDGGNLATNPHLRTHINGGNGGHIIAHESERRVVTPHTEGRWPANVVLGCCGNDPHDADCAAAMLDAQSGVSKSPATYTRNADGFGKTSYRVGESAGKESLNYGDTGGASRFFYVAKASRRERNQGLAGMPVRAAGAYGEFAGDGRGRQTEHTPRANHHPTVKPVSLMQWLVRMVTPPNGVVLDPFMGSGTTGIAASREGFRFIGIEQDETYAEIARKRIYGDAPLFADMYDEDESA